MKGNLYQVEDCDAFATAEVRDLYRRYVSAKQVDLIGSFGFGRDLAAHAEGAWITTRSGRRILDFTGGIGVLNHGHNHPRILAARAEFARKHRMEVHKNFLSPYVAALSHNIAQLMPGDLNVSYFPNSGAEAVEGALKMAYKVHGGQRAFVLHADISFHGKLFAASMTWTMPSSNVIASALVKSTNGASRNEATVNQTSWRAMRISFSTSAQLEWRSGRPSRSATSKAIP